MQQSEITSQTNIQNNPIRQRPQISSHQKQANFLTLSNLQNQLPPDLFDQVVHQINQSDGLPMRQTWDGSQQICSYQELKVNFGHDSSYCMPSLLKNQEELTEKISKVVDKKNSKYRNENPVMNNLKKKRGLLSQQFITNSKLKSRQHQFKNHILNHDSQQFKRMKTVFGHADFHLCKSLAVYNCKFDQSDQFIITGADDGIIKIWNKDNLVLQASLHGHQEVIVDIAVSHCNRYMVSGSKDGTIIIWDLQKCKIIKRLNNCHYGQVNSLQFVMIQTSERQAMINMKRLNQSYSREQVVFDQKISKSFQAMEQDCLFESNSGLIYDPQFDQFLLSCSDDGLVHVYDVSSFSDEGHDEFYMKNHGKKSYKIFSTQKCSSQERMDPLLVLKQRIDEKDAQNVKVDKESDNKETNLDQRQNKQIGSSSSNIKVYKLKPDQYRQGVRNKQIDSMTINYKGFVAAGTSSGEVYLWKVNFENIRQKKKEDLYQWVNSFKLHKKSVHLIKFSPNGHSLITGSQDGTANVWDVSFEESNYRHLDFNLIDETDPNEFQVDQKIEKNFIQNLDDIDISENHCIHKFEDKDPRNEEFKYEQAIDAIEWSLTGRYAYCAISVKEVKVLSEEEINEASNSQLQRIKDAQKPPIVKVQMFDTLAKQQINNLTKACKLQNEICNFASLLKQHPLDDQILMGCFDGGLTILYDVQRLQVIQKIEEYGIYSIDQFTMNNAYDADFTSDGQNIAFASGYGTLTLYSQNQQCIDQYNTTRIQQFFEYDKEPHSHNPYEQLTEQPQLCSYELTPYEVQPGPPLIGLFKDDDDFKITKNEKHQNYIRNQIFGKEFAQEEEKWYRDQIDEGLRLGYFNSNENVPEAASSPVAFGFVQDQAEEEQQQSDESSHLDQEEQDDEIIAQDLIGDEYSVIEDQEKLAEDYCKFIGTQVQTEAQKMGKQKRKTIDDDSQEQQLGVRRLRRSIEIEDSQDEQSDNFKFQRQTRGSRLRQVRQTRNKAELDLSMNDYDSEISQDNTKLQRKSYRSRTNSNNIRQIKQNRRNYLVSEQEYDEEDEPSSQGIAKRRISRRSHQQNQYKEISDTEENLSEKERRRQKQQKNERAKRARGRHGQESSFDDQSERKYHNQFEQNIQMDSQNEQESNDQLQIEILITSSPNETNPTLKRDDSYSQRGSKHNKGLIKKQGLFKECSKIYDEVYILDDQNQVQANEQRNCFFCKRIMDQQYLIGPFIKDKSIQLNEEQIKSDDEYPDGLYFHEKCLEINYYVQYDKQNEKWLNIQTAIQNLVLNKQFTCYRCLAPGATVQCSTCDRTFHGHYCQEKYMLALDYEYNENQCIFCRNYQNHHDFKNEKSQILFELAQTELLSIRKDLQREHLFEKNPYENNYYVPQIGDEVVYFFQGHEQFHQGMNCYFFCGKQKNMGSTDLPWMRIQALKEQPNGFVNCKVLSVTNKFASVQATYLVKEYGEVSSNVSQKHNIITYVELEILDQLQSKSKQIKFVAQMWPSDCSQYLIHKEIFNYKLSLYQDAIQKGQFVNQTFKTHLNDKIFSGNKIKVTSIQAIEPDLLQNSYWQSIIVKEAESTTFLNQGRNRRSSNIEDISEKERINFWDIIYPSEQQNSSLTDIAEKILSSAFESFVFQGLIEQAQLRVSKSKDDCQEFLDRVDIQHVSDYRSYVPSEMWINLILDRIGKKYYRSQEQLWSDLDLILFCCRVYNGEESGYTEDAETFIERLKKEFKLFINSNKDRVISKKKQGIIIGHQLENGNQKVSGLGFGFNDGSEDSQNQDHENQEILDLQPNQAQKKKSSKQKKNLLENKQSDDEDLQSIKKTSSKMSKAKIKSENKNQKSENFEDEQNKEKKGRGRPKKNKQDEDLLINDDPRIQFINGFILIDKNILQGNNDNKIVQSLDSAQQQSVKQKKQSASKSSVMEKSMNTGKKRSMKKSELIEQEQNWEIEANKQVLSPENDSNIENIMSTNLLNVNLAQNQNRVCIEIPIKEGRRSTRSSKRQKTDLR